MAGQFITNPNPPTTLHAPVAGEEMSADFLFTPGKGYSVSIDPASDVIATHSSDGMLLELAPGAAPKSAVTTFTYDAVGKKLQVAVDGTATMTVDLAALDDEGAKLVLNGQNLELQAADGTVLSSTPITQIDAQKLTGVGGAAGYKLNLSNGGDVTITCADIGLMYTSGASTPATELLSKDCKAVKVGELPIAPEQLTAGALPAGVTVPGDAINSPITNPAATVPAANVTGVLDPAVLPPTIHENKWTKSTGLTEAVNGTSSDIAIPEALPIDVLGYNGAGDPVYAPVANLPINPDQLQAGALPAGVTIPAATLQAATTHTNKWTQADGLTEDVNGVASNIVIPKDAIKGTLGYNGGGEPVWMPTDSVPINPDQLQAGALPAGVTVPATSVTGVLPASALPPTTHNNSWTKGGGLKETVNGTASDIAIAAGTIPDILGYTTAGAPAYQSLASLPIAPGQLQPGALPAGVTIPAASVTGVLPASSLPPTTHTATWDAVGKNLTTVVNGVSVVTSLASLDDEGVALAFSGGQLQLKNAAGTVLSQTPVPDLDAQAISMNATGLISITGNASTIQTTNTTVWTKTGGLSNSTNGVVGAVPVPTGVVVDVVGYNAAGGVVNQPISQLPINPNQLQPGALPAGVTIPAASVTGVLPASALPQTTHTSTLAKATGLTTVVNGVSANVPIAAATLTDLVGFDSTGAAKQQSVATLPDFWSSSTAAANTVASPNGATDLTEKIRRDGSVGLNADPVSTLDVAGSLGLNFRGITASTTADTILPTDYIVSYGGTGAVQPVTLPDPTTCPRRVIELRIGMPINSTGYLQVTSPTGGIQTPNGDMLTTAVILRAQAVDSIRWISNGTNWMLENFQSRLHYFTPDYPVPSGVSLTTFNDGGGSTGPNGYIMPQATQNWYVLDGNYTPNVVLPTGTNGTGRLSLWIINAAGFPTTVRTDNTDLPRSISIPSGVGNSMHFVWSNGLWRWVPSPNGPAASYDFWSSTTAGSNTPGMPNGTTDLTEKIRRDGSVGLNADPVSTLDVSGSYGVGNTILPAATTAYTVVATDAVVEILSGGAANSLKTVTLPNAANFPRRIITVKIANGNLTNNVDITSVGGQLEDIDGNAGATFGLRQLGSRSVTFQSDGSNWQMIGEYRGRMEYHIHRYTCGDFNNQQTFGGNSYNANDWLPIVNSMSWSHNGSNNGNNGTHGAQWLINAAGNWTLHTEIGAANDRWIITCSFIRISNSTRVTRTGMVAAGSGWVNP